MHVLYVHQNFPAQFGHIAHYLVKDHGHRCTFVSATPPGVVEGVEKIQYKINGGATKTTHFCSRTFENAIWHTDAVYQAMKARPDVKPDLIVGHSGFGSTLFLRDLYPDVPVINLFEYYYRPHYPDNDMDFRKDLGWEVEPQKYLRSRARNAMILLDLQNCNAGYAPTQFQRSCFPEEYQPKLKTLFDGIDRNVYHSHGGELRSEKARAEVRKVAGKLIPAGSKVVTYVSRGFESMRGYDIFLRAANLVCQRDPNAHVFVVGTDQISYGGDENHIDGKKTFTEWVLTKYPMDLSRIHFVGRLSVQDLSQLLATSDAHVYLTVPFVLSWSMMDAMSCGAVVVGSATSPVKEMIRDGENGVLADFFDVDAFANNVLKVIADPVKHRALGDAAERMIEEKYSLRVVLPEMLKMYENALVPSRLGREQG